MVQNFSLFFDKLKLVKIASNNRNYKTTQSLNNLEINTVVNICNFPIDTHVFVANTNQTNVNKIIWQILNTKEKYRRRVDRDKSIEILRSHFRMQHNDKNKTKLRTKFYF